MSDLIPATGHVAVFTGLDSNGRTTYHCRPLLAWTVDDDGRLVGQYLNSYGKTGIASNVPNFHRYMTEDEWALFRISQLPIGKPAGSGAS